MLVVCVLSPNEEKFLNVFEIEHRPIICISGPPNSSIGDWEDLIKYNSKLGPNIFLS